MIQNEGTILVHLDKFS